MKILHLEMVGLNPFEGHSLKLDLFARDQVRDAGPGNGLMHIGDKKSSIYSQNVVCITGINASGKTTSLRALDFVTNVLNGNIGKYYGSYRQSDLLAFESEISLSVIFALNNDFYLLESKLSRITEDDEGDADIDSDALQPFVFTQETMWRFNKTQPHKAQLSDPGMFRDNASIVKLRIPLSQKEQYNLQTSRDLEDECFLTDESVQFLSPQASISNAFTIGDQRLKALNSPDTETPDIVPTRFSVLFPASVDWRPMSSIANPILHVFDDSIEYFTTDEQKKVHVKFSDSDKEMVMSRRYGSALLSSGTKRGALLVTQSIRTLRTGGYLFVDEIENSINKELVHMIVNLFVAKKTNPKGATLVFSTHYPELLDIINRKDNIYILRRSATSNRVQTVNYTDEVKRGELKRSEVFLSNYIGGTAPKATELTEILRYVALRVRGAAHDE
ncbi:ATP/GTP-binding protein [Bifidobacterium aquikefiricola]|uniref:ATP-binding protein n=1 Tax=Bifidobacterium aquikefiricola TaxID=3059038 RepID=A0AB39U7T5_9BIFI